jgi:hypothetical protein
MLRGNVKSTGYSLHSPVSPSLPCVTVCHHISTVLYLRCGLIPFVKRTDSTVNQGRLSQKRQSSCHALGQLGTQSGQSNSLQLPHDGYVMTYWALVHIAPLCQPHRFRRSVRGLKFPRTCSYGLAFISLKHGTSQHIGQLTQIGSLFWGFTFHGQVAIVMFGSPEGPEVDYRTSRPSGLPYLHLGKFMDSGVLSVALQILLRPFRSVIKVKVKAKFTLEQATRAQRWNRGITLLFL